MRCKAKSKRSGEQCRKHAMLGREVCYNHGGKSLVGIASPQLRHGRHSKYMPSALRERVEEARNDRDLLNLREEIELTDGLISERVERLNSGESDRVWKALASAVPKLKAATAAQDMEKLFDVSINVTGLLEQGLAVRSAMQDVVSLIETRRKLVESEVKRLEKLHQFARFEDVSLLLHRVFSSVRTHVMDQRTLALIADDLAPVLRGTNTMVEESD